MTTLSNARLELGRRDLETLRESFGPLLWACLNDRAVTDVLLNGNGVLFEDRQGQGMTRIGVMDPHAAQSIINLVAAVAGETAGRGALITEAELPIRNARFIGFTPPITQNPSFAIRLPPTRIFSLQNYVEAGIATARQVEVIEAVIEQEDSILVAGGTGSGKSTLLNAILQAIHHTHPAKRVGLIEEIIELQFEQENVLALRTGPNVDHQELLKRLMRTRPDIIVFGEVRDRAAMQLVEAANTGHDTILSTVHANTPMRALERMEDLCAKAIPGMPGESFRSQIGNAMKIIIGIERLKPNPLLPEGPSRRVTEIIAVTGVTNNAYDTVKLA